MKIISFEELEKLMKENGIPPVELDENDECQCDICVSERKRIAEIKKAQEERINRFEKIETTSQALRRKEITEEEFCEEMNGLGIDMKTEDNPKSPWYRK